MAVPSSRKRRHHLAVLRSGLGANEHVVAVADAGIHHAVALHAQRVDVGMTREDAIHGEPVFHCLHRLHAGTGGNRAADRYARYSQALQHLHLGRKLVGAPGRAAQVPFDFQALQMVVRRRR